MTETAATQEKPTLTPYQRKMWAKAKELALGDKRLAKILFQGLCRRQVTDEQLAMRCPRCRAPLLDAKGRVVSHVTCERPQLELLRQPA